MSATIPWRRAEIPAAGGHGNARSVALVHAPMACGGEANGVRLLSPKTIDMVFDEQCYGPDLVLGIMLRHGIGFGLPCPEMPISPNERACFWGGWGGSLAIIDLDARVTISYVMNKMGEGTTGDMRGANIVLATYMSLAQCLTQRQRTRRGLRGRGVGFLGEGVAVGQAVVGDGGQDGDRRGATATVDEPVDHAPAQPRRRSGAATPGTSIVLVATMIHARATSAAGGPRAAFVQSNTTGPSPVSMMFSGWKSRWRTASGAPNRESIASVADRDGGQPAVQVGPRLGVTIDAPRPRRQIVDHRHADEPLHHDVAAVDVEHLGHRVAVGTHVAHDHHLALDDVRRGADPVAPQHPATADVVDVGGPSAADQPARFTHPSSRPAGRRPSSC